MEGHYIDVFYGEGKRIINTKLIREKEKNLNTTNKQNVIILDNKELNFKNKTISFALRPKDYLSDIFSYYYFRILYLQKNEKLYFPIDSQIGNLCLPEYDNVTNLYHCNFIFPNKYGELETNFSISSFNQNEYFKI
mgnify:FL=1